MQSVWLVLLVVVLGITAFNTVYAPVMVTPGDVIDRLDASHIVPTEDYEAGRAWVWNLGSPANGGVLRLDASRYISRELGLLVCFLVACMICRKHPSQAQYAATAVTRIMWLFPLIIYGAAAMWRLVYVPCFLIERQAWERVPAVVWHYTLPLWNVDSEGIRYGLILFEEFVLLVCVATWYAATFAVFPHLWRKIRRAQ